MKEGWGMRGGKRRGEEKRREKRRKGRDKRREGEQEGDGKEVTNEYRFEGQKRRGDEQRRRGWRAFVRELCRNFRLRNFDVVLWFRIHFSSFHICIVLIPCPIVM